MMDAAGQVNSRGDQKSTAIHRDLNIITSSGLYEPRDVVMLTTHENLNLNFVGIGFSGIGLN